MAGPTARPNQRRGASPAGRNRAAAASPPASRPTVLGRVFARPGTVVAGATFAAIMTGIVTNALLLQRGHHPSPLFSQAPAAATAPAPVVFAPPTPVPVSKPPVADPVPVPGPQEAPAPAIKAPVPAVAMHKGVSKPAVAGSAQAAKPARKPATAPHRDLIGDLINHKAQ